MVATPLTRAMSSHLATSLGRSGVSGFSPPPLDNSNVLLRTLASQGFVNGTHLPDELRSGTTRELQPGRCLQITGATQSVGLNSTIGDGSAITVAFQFSRTTGAATGTAVSKAAAAGTAFQWSVHVNGVGVLTANQFTAAGGTFRSLGGIQLSDAGAWHKIVVALSTAATRVWVDGTLYENTAAGSGTWGTSGGILRVGERGDVSNAAFGKYSNLRIWHTARTTDIAAANWYTLIGSEQLWWKLDQPNSALQQDSSGNANHGTITNWATGVHYSGSNVPKSWQNDEGFSADNGTNLIASPNDFSGWTATNTTYAANQEYEVGNTLVADRFFETTTNGVHSAKISQAVSSTSGTAPYTFVFDVKGIGRTQFYARVFNTGETAKTEALFDTSALTVTALAGTTFRAAGTSIESLGGGLYRCKLGCLPTASQTALIPAVFSYNGSTDSFVGDITKGFYLANAKLVLGSTHTPRKESAPTTDVLANMLQYTGQGPARPRLINSHCLTLNGSNQYVTVGTGTWSTDGTQAMEIEWVANPTNFSNYRVIAANNTSAGWSAYYYATTGAVEFNLTDGTLACRVRTINGATAGAWQRGKITYDGSKNANNIAVYMDGIRQQITVVANTLVGSSANAGAPSQIAALNSALPFLGSLAYFKLTIGATVWEYTLAEGSGTNIYEIRGATSHAIVNAGTNWSVLQNVYHANITRGFRLASGVKIPCKYNSTTLAADNNALTNPIDADALESWHNMAETALDFTCGQSAAPIFNGQTITDIDDYVTGRSVTLLQKIATATYERQYQLVEP